MKSGNSLLKYYHSFFVSHSSMNASFELLILNGKYLIWGLASTHSLLYTMQKRKTLNSLVKFHEKRAKRYIQVPGLCVRHHHFWHEMLVHVKVTFLDSIKRKKKRKIYVKQIIEINSK